MTLYEIEGFLRGKCLPGDLLVGESTAGYIFRKFKERDEARTELSSAMLTISQITDVVGTNDTLSISQQVAELAEGKDTFLQIALSEVAEHFDMLPNAGTREWDAVKLSCMNKLREIF